MAGLFDGFRRRPVGSSPLTRSTVEEATALLRAGRQIHAVKLVRERTNLGLADAKNITDALREGRWVPVAPEPGFTLADQVRELRTQGRRDEAIALVGRETGMTEPESARFIDSLDP